MQGVKGVKAVKMEGRVCANCGLPGHMKTSKKLCPRWDEFNQVRPLLPLLFALTYGFSLQPKPVEPTGTLETAAGKVAAQSAGTATSPAPP